MARTKGATNKATRDVKGLLDEASASYGRGDRDGFAVAVRKLFDRAHGVMAEREVQGERVVYEVPPDVLAIKTLLEFRFGKAKESVEVSTPEMAINSIPIVAMMQLPKKKPE